METLKSQVLAQKPLNTVLHVILDRMSDDLAGVIGSSIVVQQSTDHDETGDNDEIAGKHEPLVLAANGVESELIHAQLNGSSGPLVDALGHEVPVIALDLWSDERWPDLTREAFATTHGGSEDVWDQVKGAAALPGILGHGCTIALTCTLSRPADASAITTLIGYEQIVSAALIIATAQDTASIHDALKLVVARSAIDRAKGAVMGRLSCNAELAGARLRSAAQEMDVGVPELSVALLDYISDAPIRKASVPATEFLSDQRTRAAAQRFWSTLY